MAAKLNALDPLSHGFPVHDSHTKRLLQRKKREVEAQKEQEEKAKLAKKMAMLKKEAAKRLRKQQ